MTESGGPRAKAGARRSVAVFGGTFDPIHNGHMAAAQAAMRRFALNAIYFVPSGRPPHKPKHSPQLFAHRYAMVALACSGHRGYAASLAEAPGETGDGAVFYSLDTVRRFRRQFPNAHLYFLLGADSFQQLPTWHRYQDLLQACDFAVASRPGVSMKTLQSVMPLELLPHTSGVDARTISPASTAVHLLAGVKSRVSSSEIRRRLASGRSIKGLVPKTVEEYIEKQALYR
jgi:nicotinate-nucleotide adenylyltransferase